MFKNKLTINTISFLLFISIFNVFFTYTIHPLIKNLDELILIISIIIFFFLTFYSKKIKKLTFWVIIIYFVLFLISINGPNFNFLNVVIQLIIHLKFFIYFLVIYYIYNNNNNELIRLFYTIVIFSFIGILLNIILQENFNQLFDLRNMYRNSLLRINGFQFNSNSLSYLVAIFFIYFTFKYKNIKLFIFFSIFFIFFNLYITGARTPLFIYPILFYYFFSQEIKIPRLIILTILLFLFFFILTIFQDSTLISSLLNNINMINGGDDSEKYIRGIMIYYSIVLSIEYFPIGTGAASYGSVMSKGSQVYINLDIDKLRFFRDMSGVYDCNIATILGEFGIVGIILFGLLFWKLWSFLKKNNSNNNMNYYKVLIILIFFIMLKGSMLMHSYTSLIFAMALNIKILPERKK